MTSLEAFAADGLGAPALVCRWRLAGGRLPMANRHLRALRSREIGGRAIPQPLVAWAKEHVDWTLERGAAQYPDGVLMLAIDKKLRAAMAVGPYKPLDSPTMHGIVARSRASRKEAETTRVAPETMWLVRDGQMVWIDEPTNVASGAASFVADLARTLGITVIRSKQQLSLSQHTITYEGAFMVSDEHGVVVPEDRRSVLAQRLADGYGQLLQETMRRDALRRSHDGETGGCERPT